MWPLSESSHPVLAVVGQSTRMQAKQSLHFWNSEDVMSPRLPLSSRKIAMVLTLACEQTSFGNDFILAAPIGTTYFESREKNCWSSARHKWLHCPAWDSASLHHEDESFILPRPKPTCTTNFLGMCLRACASGYDRRHCCKPSILLSRLLGALLRRRWVTTHT